MQISRIHWGSTCKVSQLEFPIWIPRKSRENNERWALASSSVGVGRGGRNQSGTPVYCFSCSSKFLLACSCDLSVAIRFFLRIFIQEDSQSGSSDTCHKLVTLVDQCLISWGPEIPSYCLPACLPACFSCIYLPLTYYVFFYFCCCILSDLKVNLKGKLWVF